MSHGNCVLCNKKTSSEVLAKFGGYGPACAKMLGIQDDNGNRRSLDDYIDYLLKPTDKKIGLNGDSDLTDKTNNMLSKYNSELLKIDRGDEESYRENIRIALFNVLFSKKELNQDEVKDYLNTVEEHTSNEFNKDFNKAFWDVFVNNFKDKSRGIKISNVLVSFIRTADLAADQLAIGVGYCVFKLAYISHEGLKSLGDKINEQDVATRAKKALDDLDKLRNCNKSEIHLYTEDYEIIDYILNKNKE